MLRDQYEQMAELQDHHWWFAAKRRIVDTLVRQYATHGGDRRPAANWVLDAGCGDGRLCYELRHDLLRQPRLNPAPDWEALTAPLRALQELNLAGVD